MLSQAIMDRGWRLTEDKVAIYFGLMVELILRMENYSLIRYGGRESIVRTDDLSDFVSVKGAAA